MRRRPAVPASCRPPPSRTHANLVPSPSILHVDWCAAWQAGAGRRHLSETALSHVLPPLLSTLAAPQYKWALWQVDESGTAVIIAAVGDKNSTWQDFLAALPDADCRYGGGWVGELLLSEAAAARPTDCLLVAAHGTASA